MSDWMMEDGELDAELAFVGTRGATRGPSTARAVEPSRNVAVFLRPLVVRDTGKWFGSANLRLDAIVSHGGSAKATLFHPTTVRFPRVVDGDDLAGEDNGLLIFYGKPAHFLVMNVALSRDTGDSDDLAALIHREAEEGSVAALIGQLGAAASPHIAAVQAGLQAALGLGELAYKLVRQVSPVALGLYRASWLGQRHGFGVGRHPAAGTRREKDFELAYEIVVDEHDHGG